MIPRSLHLPEPGTETFFLWGPRQTGKSTLLRATYPDAWWVDLLRADQYRRFAQRPERLRQDIQRSDTRPFVVIDEVQHVPRLLDEVHLMHETMGLRFALCGSSARKVRRGKANLLGGRGLRYHMYGLSAAELGATWDLLRMVNHGFLPSIYLADNPTDLLDGYVSDYLREELTAEGRAQMLPVFADFLHIAAIGDTEQVNFSSIGRECAVSHHTVRGYYQILVDTLQGEWLPVYRRRPKRRTVSQPKFYFADLGVVNYLARRGWLEPGSELFGKAMESWVFHELRCYNWYRRRHAAFAFWRLTSGVEVDFIINDMEVAIEVKSAHAITRDHLRGLRQLVKDHPNVKRRLVVSTEPTSWRSDDGIDILSPGDFVSELWGGDFF